MKGRSLFHFTDMFRKSSLLVKWKPKYFVFYVGIIFILFIFISGTVVLIVELVIKLMSSVFVGFSNTLFFVIQICSEVKHDCKLID